VLKLLARRWMPLLPHKFFYAVSPQDRNPLDRLIPVINAFGHKKLKVDLEK